MQLGMIGLGRMGGNLVRRLLRTGIAAPSTTVTLNESGIWPTKARSLRRQLAAKGLKYIDVGTSGGIWGSQRGYCLMIGGDKAIVERLDPIFAVLATGCRNVPCTPGRERRDERAERGYLHAGSCGAGHLVKMVHNGIEYGFAEGFEILKRANSQQLQPELRFEFDLVDIAEVWRHGSVIDLLVAARSHGDRACRRSRA